MRSAGQPHAAAARQGPAAQLGGTGAKAVAAAGAGMQPKGFGMLQAAAGAAKALWLGCASQPGGVQGSLHNQKTCPLGLSRTGAQLKQAQACKRACNWI